MLQLERSFLNAFLREAFKGERSEDGDIQIVEEKFSKIRGLL